MNGKLNSAIIAFEGLDCSFKETNFNKFVEHLTVMRGANNLDSYFSVHSESFPRYGKPGCAFVSNWLNGTFDRSMLKANPSITDTFYALDRFEYWFERNSDGVRHIDLLNNYDKFRYFVFDRYNISNAIYNPIYPGVDKRDFTFDRDKFQIPLPDIVVWFRMHSFDKLCEFIAAKEEKDSNELDIEFLRKVWERSEEIISSDVFRQLGIKLIVIECLDKNGNPRPKPEIDWNVWTSITSAVRYE